MDARLMAVNEARALRLVLASLRADENGRVRGIVRDGDDIEAATRAMRMVFDEIDCDHCLEYVAEVLAAKLAGDMACADGPFEAARKVAKRIAFLLDFAGRGDEHGND
jgi:hypothetical protein